jgi:hypothetical protein
MDISLEHLISKLNYQIIHKHIEEQQEQNQEGQNEQPEVVVEQPKKNIIPTRLGSLIILLIATIAGVGVWWYSFSYEEPVPIDVGQVMRELQVRREVNSLYSPCSPYVSGEINSQYEVRSDGVYYIERLLENADAETFQDLGKGYAKDKNSIFVDGVSKSSFDAATFQILENYYTKDKDSVHRGHAIVSDADAGTFEVIGLFAKDKNHVYCDNDVVEGFDIQTFENINDWYIADVDSIYFCDGLYGVDIIDRNEFCPFKIFEDKYARDNNYVYYEGRILEDANPASFSVIDSESDDYSKDDKNVFIRAWKTEATDPQTFELSKRAKDYARDKNNFYYKGHKLDFSIDWRTLTNVCSSYDNSLVWGLAKDRNYLYLNGEILEGFNPKTFEYLAVDYYKDIKEKYVITNLEVCYNGEVVKSESVIIPDDIPEEYFNDGQSYYTDAESSVEYQLSVNQNEFRTDYFSCCGGIDCRNYKIKEVPHIHRMSNGDVLIFATYNKSRGNVCGLNGAIDYNIFNIYLLDSEEHILKRVFSGLSDGAQFESDFGDRGLFGGRTNFILSNDWREIKLENQVGGIVWSAGKYCYDFETKEYILCEQGDYVLGKERACLASGTKILMSDGSYKNIENIQVGDLVTSFKIEMKEYKTAKVDKVIKRKDPLVIINNTLRAAPDEPVYLADGNIKEAVDIKIGDYLISEKGNAIEVVETRYDAKVVDTYDFTLENGDNFFADGYLVGTPDL